MPEITIEKRSCIHKPRPHEVDLKITWPDQLSNGNDFLLEYRNRDPLVIGAGWQAIGSYYSKKQAQEAADGFVGSEIKDADWSEWLIFDDCE